MKRTLPYTLIDSLRSTGQCRATWILIICLSLGIIPHIAAQEREQLRTEELTITKEYKPVTFDFDKITHNPSIQREVTEQKIKVYFDTDSYAEITAFEIPVIEAETYTENDEVLYKKNYIDLQFGSYLTSVADMYFAGFLNQQTLFGVQLRHHSSVDGVGELADVEDSFMKNHATLFLQHTYATHHTFRVETYYDHHQYRHFGLPEVTLGEAVQEIGKTLDPRQQYHIVGGELQFVNNAPRRMRNGFEHATIEIDFLTDLNKNQELHSHINLGFEAGKYFNIGTDVRFIHTEFIAEPLVDEVALYKRLYLNVPMHLYFEGNNYRVRAGVQIQSFSDLTLDLPGLQNTDFFFFPDVYIHYDMAGDLLRFKVSVGGDLDPNHYNQLYRINPYIYPRLRTQNTVRPLTIGAGFDGKFSEDINYAIGGEYARTNGLRQFLLLNKAEEEIDQTNLLNNNNAFGIYYDTADVYTVKAEISFDNRDYLRLDIAGRFNKYILSEDREVIDYPELEIDMHAIFTPTDSWSFSSNVEYVSGRRWRGVVAGIDETALSPYIDIGLRVDYHLNEYVTFFAQGINLLNKQYELYKNYRTQPVMGLGGIRIRF